MVSYMGVAHIFSNCKASLQPGLSEAKSGGLTRKLHRAPVSLRSTRATSVQALHHYQSGADGDGNGVDARAGTELFDDRGDMKFDRRD